MALAIVRHPAGVTALARLRASVNSLRDVTRPAVRPAAFAAAAALVRLSRPLRCRPIRAGAPRETSLEHRLATLFPRASGFSGPRMLAFRFVQLPPHEALFIPVRFCSSPLRDRRS